MPPVSEMMVAFTEICGLVSRRGVFGKGGTHDVRHGGLGDVESADEKLIADSGRTHVVKPARISVYKPSMSTCPPFKARLHAPGSASQRAPSDDPNPRGETTSRRRSPQPAPRITMSTSRTHPYTLGGTLTAAFTLWTNWTMVEERGGELCFCAVRALFSFI